MMNEPFHQETQERNVFSCQDFIDEKLVYNLDLPLYIPSGKTWLAGK